MCKLLIASLCLFSALLVAEQRQLTVAVFNYPPALILGDEKRPGYCFEIVERIYSAQGYQVNKVQLNLARAIHEVVNTNIDILCAIGKENSPNLLLSTIPSARLKYYFWARKNMPFEYTGPDSLNGYTLVNVKGYNYGPASPEFQRYLESHPRSVRTLTGENAITRAFSMIRDNKIDLFCIDEWTADYTLQKLGMRDEFHSVGELPNYFDGFLAVSPTHPKAYALLAQYEKGYIELLERGVINRIHRKYGVHLEEVVQYARSKGRDTSTND